VACRHNGRHLLSIVDGLEERLLQWRGPPLGQLAPRRQFCSGGLLRDWGQRQLVDELRLGVKVINGVECISHLGFLREVVDGLVQELRHEVENSLV